MSTDPARSEKDRAPGCETDRVSDGINSLFDFSDVPDLVTAWPCEPDRCDRQRHKGLTPRGAYALWSTAEVLADYWNEHLALPSLSSSDRPALDPWFDDLPPIARRLGTTAWLSRFAASFTDLAAGVASGHLELACTGEEVAFRILLSDCARALNDGLVIPPNFDEWPGHGDDFDFDLNRIETIVCWDYDVEWLWDPALDGIEGGEIAESPLIGAVNLHPRDWFHAFEDATRIPSPGPPLPSA